MTKKKAKKAAKPKTKATKKPGVATRKPTETPPAAAESPLKPTDPSLIDGSLAAPLDPGAIPARVPQAPDPGPKDKGGRPKLTADEKKDRAAARVAEREDEERSEQTALSGKIDITTKIVVGMFKVVAKTALPPELPNEEEVMLFEGWKPLVEQYEGDIPPAVLAGFTTFIVFWPRLMDARRRAKEARQ